MASKTEPDFVHKGVRYTLYKQSIGKTCKGCAFYDYPDAFESCAPTTRKCDSPDRIYKIAPDPANLVTYRLTK